MIEVLIEESATVFVHQHVVGLREFAKHIDRTGFLVLIGVVRLRQLSIGLFDVLRRAILLYLQHVIAALSTTENLQGIIDGSRLQAPYTTHKQRRDYQRDV